MKKQYGEYYLGLDIGTSSVGWAVTDLEYRVLKFNGKAMWGIHLFDEAKTAEERRLHRSARRRNLRKVNRVKLLQALFAEEMAQKDFGFFMRLADSSLWEEDKREKQPHSFFCDKDYTDKEFFAQYPTIYHLRKELMQSKEPHDIRLVYLAIHHILKHRGHFLYQGSFEDVAEMKVDMMLSELIAAAEEILSISLSAIDGEEIANVLQNPDYGITKKKQELLKLFNYQKEDKKAVTTLMNLLAGGTVNLSDLFSDESLDSCGQKKITFKGSSYDDNETLFRETLLDRFGVIEASKKLYDWAILQNILNGKTSISEAKVEVYEQHQTDLTLLKGMVRAYCPEKYKEVFGIPKEKTANYSAYVGSGMLKGKKIIVEKGCTQEKFYDYLCKTVFKGITAEDEAFDNMMEQIERGNFLPKQKSKDNGFIPYQIHLKELEMILENASAYLPFLTEKEEDGHTVREKIVSIMTFRIPYYVGPLNGAHRDSGFYWAIKKSQEPIRPWNFDEVIDREASAEKFIRRMTNKCTYLIKEDVIPKDSLYYSAFTVLNELNNLRINGDKISVDLKQKIFQDLFLQEKKVKQNRLKRYLIEEGYHGKNEEISITGIDGDFKASMTSYIDFKGILGKEIFTDKEKAMVEDLIKYIVLFGDEKKMLDQKIRTTYGDVLTEKQISEIKKRKYSQWGRFSKKLLTEICVVDVATGEYISILSALYNHEENPNFMQLLGKEYPYGQLIQEYNGAETRERKEIAYKDLSDLYISVPVKRAVWRTIKIVNELVKILGHAPKKIFIEVARGEDRKKERTKSRKEQLLELYKACGADSRLMDSLQTQTEQALRKDKLFLYYLQLGKCMYSGEVIDLDDLDRYDIDHIYPQSKVMDDSLENRVLVLKTLNAKKSDQYPLPAEYRENPKVRKHWDLLKRKDLISAEKYGRLTRNTPFTLDEQAGFVARQLVETQQSTKAVAGLFQQMFGKETEIVYSKARNVTAFRRGIDDYEKGHTKTEIAERKESNQFIKVREINDYHHAKDAYLNIVVGNVFNSKFTSNAYDFFKGKEQQYSLNAMYKFPISRGGIVAWIPTSAEKEGTMAIVKRQMAKNNIQFTRMQREENGGLFDLTLMKKGKGQVPQKGNGPRSSIGKYGGYNKPAVSYFFLVESTDKKGNRIRTIESLRLYKKKGICCRGDLEAYCIEQLGLKEPKILMEKILINSLLEQNGFRMFITAKNGKRDYALSNANQFVVSDEDTAHLKKVCSFVMEQKNKKQTSAEQYGITKERNLQMYDLLFRKLRDTVYKEKLSAQVASLEKGRPVFEGLELKEQCLVLTEILCFFHCDRVTSNLSLIGGVPSAGVLTLGKNITKMKNLNMIMQSVTGLFEQKIDLGTL